MTTRYHPEAEAELIEAAKFYAARVAGLGSDFLDEAERAIGSIVGTPTRWRRVDGEVRAYPMRRFPYTILYRAFPEHIHILAIKHDRRLPGYWRPRLAD